MPAMTEISRQRMTAALNPMMSPEEAVKLLQDNAYRRNLLSEFSKYLYISDSNTDEIKAKLTANIQATYGEQYSTVAETMRKNITNWTKKDCYKISRENAVMLCFAMGLPYEEADNFLSHACEEKFHLRTPEDIVYKFAMDTEMTYSAACAMLKEFEGKGLLTVPHDEDTGKESSEGMTRLVAQEAAKIQSPTELEKFLQDNQGHLGLMHNTAYKYFMEYIKILQTPVQYTEKELREYEARKRKFGDAVADEVSKNMSVKEILETYLHKTEIRRANNNTLAGLIRREWPDNVAISRMMNREIDVSRKALILLFVATDGGGGDCNPERFARRYPAQQARIDAIRTQHLQNFKSSVTRLDLLLLRCGYPRLDIRNPFDWVICYCLAVEETSDTDEKMTNFLKELFDNPA